jgi:hypothetical protein
MSVIRKQILSHLLESHRVTVDTPSPEPTGDLMDVIPGLPVFSAAQCPVAGCGRWMSGKSSLAGHTSIYHRELQRPVSYKSLPKRFICRPYYHIVDSKEARYAKVFFFSPEWIPPPIPPPITQPSPALRNNSSLAPTAPFLLDIGWPQYLTMFQKSSQPLFRDLVRLRSNAEVKALPKGPIRRLESSLLLLRQLYIRYIIDIQRYNCSTNHDGVRILTQG